jgi:DsbC/DsbD-like thiol-disulfide interchange protein
MRSHGPALLALTLLAAGPAAAQQKSEDVVRWTATRPAAAVKPGGTTPVQLKAEILSGWYMYALTQLEGGPPALEIAVAKGQPFTLDPQHIEGPLPDVTKGSAGEPDVFHYDGKVTLSVPVGAPKMLKLGKHTVPIEVTYQVCSGSICLRPATTTLPVTLTVR